MAPTAHGNPPPGAPPLRADGLVPDRQVSWLTDRHLRPPSQGSGPSGVWAGLPVHSCATAPASAFASPDSLARSGSQTWILARIGGFAANPGLLVPKGLDIPGPQTV